MCYTFKCTEDILCYQVIWSTRLFYLFDIVWAWKTFLCLVTLEIVEICKKWQKCFATVSSKGLKIILVDCKLSNLHYWIRKYHGHNLFLTTTSDGRYRYPSTRYFGSSTQTVGTDYVQYHNHTHLTLIFVNNFIIMTR